MGRFLSVFLVLLLVVAVTTILITPDPTDDVEGVVRSAHVQFSLVILTFFRNSIDSVSSAILSAQVGSIYPAQPDELMNLLCVWIC